MLTLQSPIGTAFVVNLDAETEPDFWIDLMKLTPLQLVCPVQWLGSYWQGALTGLTSPD